MSLADDAVDYDIKMYNLGLSGEAPSLRRLEVAIRMEVACTVFFWVIIYAAKANFLVIYWRTFCLRRGPTLAWSGIAALTALSFGILLLSVFWVCGSASKVGNIRKALETYARFRSIDYD